MKRLGLALISLLILGLALAQAQNQTNPAIVGGTGAYNASPPTCTDGNWCTLQTDANGVLKTTGSGTGGTIVTTTAVNVTPVDCSGTITSGGTAQNAFAAGATTHGFMLMNLSTDPMWISFNGAAVVGTQGSYILNPGATSQAGGSFTSPPGFGMNTALSVIAATTGDKFTCTRW